MFGSASMVPTIKSLTDTNIAIKELNLINMNLIGDK